MPVYFFSTVSISLVVIFFVLESLLTIFPVISNVSVSIPKVIVAIYSFLVLTSSSDNFNVFPMHKTNSPVARGSSVPV